MSTITWRNVDKLSSDEMGKSFLDAAQQSGNASIGAIGTLYKAYQATADTNQATLKTNATNEFMRQLLAAKNTQELDAATPALNDMLVARGAGIDQSAAMTALDNRRPLMQARDTSNTAFNNAQIAEQQRPLVDAYNVLVQKQDKLGMAAFEAAHPEIKDWGALLANARKVSDGITQNTLTNEKTAQEIAASKLTSAAASKNADTQAGQLKVAQENARLNGITHVNNELSKAGSAIGDISKQSIKSSEGLASVYKAIDSVVTDPAHKEALQRYAAKAATDPKNENLTASDLTNALLQIKDDRTYLGRLVGNNSFDNATVEAALEKVRTSTETIEAAKNRNAALGLTQQRAKSLYSELKKLQYPNGDPVENNQVDPAAAPAAVPTQAVLPVDPIAAVKKELKYQQPPGMVDVGLAVQNRLARNKPVEAAPVPVTKIDVAAVTAEASKVLEMQSSAERLKNANKIQQSAAFGLLPKNIQTDIWAVVNGREPKKRP